MNQKTMITVGVFVVGLLIVLGIEQYVLHVSGGFLKLIIGLVIAAIAAGIAFAVVKTPTAS
ncbi:MAG TPA: hypothetical protein VKQ72_16090 [Aggregatilineales bacterium]|nr:hypothetical protein [Aggregatilineales bacterium]